MASTIFQFETPDVGGRRDVSSSPASSSESSTESILEFTDPDSNTITFSLEEIHDIEKLRQHIPKARDAKQVIITALQILAASVTFKVEIESKYNQGTRTVKGLWTHQTQ